MEKVVNEINLICDRLEPIKIWENELIFEREYAQNPVLFRG